MSNPQQIIPLLLVANAVFCETRRLRETDDDSNASNDNSTDVKIVTGVAVTIILLCLCVINGNARTQGSSPATAV